MPLPQVRRGQQLHTYRMLILLTEKPGDIIAEKTLSTYWRALKELGATEGAKLSGIYIRMLGECKYFNFCQLCKLYSSLP